MKAIKRVLAAAVLCAFASAAFGQVVIGGNGGNAAVGGVAISTDGVISVRQVAGPGAPVTPAGGKKFGAADVSTLYVSLPRVLEAWKTAVSSGKVASDDVKFLHGMTQVRNVFVYPDQHDIVLAGPAEPMRLENPLEPLGAVNGRPVVQLEDLIVAMRCVNASRAGGGRGMRAGGGSGLGGRDFFGCSLDAPENTQAMWDATIKKYENGPRNILVEQMKKVLGPQHVSLFGVPDDSRVGLVMLAADYRLKRLCLGVETNAVLGNGLGSQEAMARLWFEPAYDPLLVSADGNSFELKGPRLKVMCGAQVFQAGGAGPAQTKFAENFSKKMTDVAAKVDAVADLQNVTDCFMVAALIRQDKLAEKAGLDWAWLMDAGALKTASLVVPKTAETLVHVNGNVISQGGVSLAVKNLTGVERTDGAKEKTAFASPRQRPEGEWFVSVKAK